MNVRELPEEILLKIFSCLSLKDLHWGVRQACKTWHNLTYELPLWKKVDLDENKLSTKLGNDSFLKLIESISDQVEEIRFGQLKYLSDETLIHNGIFCPNLKCLNFTETDVSANAICKLLQKYPETDQIFIKNCESVNLLEVLDEICKLRNLKKLMLGNSLKKFKNEDAEEWNVKLQLLFKSSPCLQEVEFMSRNLNNETVQVLLASCPNLETLSVANCSDISDDAFEDEMVCKKLKNLNLTSTGISDKGLEKIAKNIVNLKSVNVKKCVHVTDIGFGHLAVNCKNLEKLVINDIQFADGNITDGGIQQLSQGCRNLRVLQVNYCPGVSNQGVIAVAEHCPRLQEIGVAGCMSLTDNAVLALANNCREIQSVNLTSCVQIHARSINSLILKCQKLKTLKLETCHSVSELNFDRFLDMETPFTKYDRNRNKNFSATAFDVTDESTQEKSSSGEKMNERYSGELENENGNFQNKPSRKILNEPKLMLNTTKDSYFINNERKGKGTEQILEITKELSRRHSSESELLKTDTELVTVAGMSDDLVMTDTNSEEVSQVDTTEHGKDNVDSSENEIICKKLKSDNHIVREEDIFKGLVHVPMHSRLTVLHIGFCSKIRNDAIRQIAMHCPDLVDFSICACYQVTDSAIEFLVQKCKFLQILDISGGSPLESTKLTNRSLLALAKFGANIRELVVLRNNLITPEGIKEVLVNCTQLQSIWFLTGESTPVSLQAVLSIISFLTNRVAKLRTYKVPVWSDFGGRRSRVKVELFDTAFMH